MFNVFENSIIVCGNVNDVFKVVGCVWWEIMRMVEW